MNGKKQLFALAVLLCSISQPLFAISEVELIKMIDREDIKKLHNFFQMKFLALKAMLF